VLSRFPQYSQGQQNDAFDIESEVRSKEASVRKQKVVGEEKERTQSKASSATRKYGTWNTLRVIG